MDKHIIAAARKTKRNQVKIMRKRNELKKNVEEESSIVKTGEINSRWSAFHINDEVEPANTTITDISGHILGFHTTGKQNIKAQIFGLNKTERKYTKPKPNNIIVLLPS